MPAPHDDLLARLSRNPELVRAYRAFRGDTEEPSSRPRPPLPLDLIFGYPSHVRLLRVLAAHMHPKWPAELTRASGLSRSGAWMALVRLHELQLIEPIHQWAHGTGVPVRRDRQPPRAVEIENLFFTEWRARRARAEWVAEMVAAAAAWRPEAVPRAPLLLDPPDPPP